MFQHHEAYGTFDDRASWGYGNSPQRWRRYLMEHNSARKSILHPHFFFLTPSTCRRLVVTSIFACSRLPIRSRRHRYVLFWFGNTHWSPQGARQSSIGARMWGKVQCHDSYLSDIGKHIPRHCTTPERMFVNWYRVLHLFMHRRAISQ
jgi:hypothetical protein